MIPDNPEPKRSGHAARADCLHADECRTAPDEHCFPISEAVHAGHSSHPWRTRPAGGNRSWGRRATLIALTGWGQTQDRESTAEAGFDAHLVKPVAEFDLFQALAAACTVKEGTTSPRPNTVTEPRCASQTEYGDLD
jgi:hypothetical protein